MVFLLGMILIAVCFLVSAMGIRSIIDGDMVVFYAAAVGLVLLLVLVIVFSWIIHRHHPLIGTGMSIPPPPGRHDDLIEREPL
jgi:hypothetical protein